jgi:hypothetical protein
MSSPSIYLLMEFATAEGCYFYLCTVYASAQYAAQHATVHGKANVHMGGKWNAVDVL